MLSVYMRPWTLNIDDLTEQNPMLRTLSSCTSTSGSHAAGITIAEPGIAGGCSGCEEVPVTQRSQANATEITVAETGIAGGCHGCEKKPVTLRSPSQHGQDIANQCTAEQNKMQGGKEVPLRVRSYASSWENYINGNVVSQLSKRYIMHIVGPGKRPTDSYRCPNMNYTFVRLKTSIPYSKNFNTKFCKL